MTPPRQRASRRQCEGHAGRVLLVFLLAVPLLGRTAAGAEPAAHDGTQLSVVVLPPPAGTSATATEWQIYLDGYLDAGSASRVAGAVSGQGIQRAVVYLNSPGGSLLAGMAIGRLLREWGFDTEVGTRTTDPLRPSAGVCYSACPFVYAGGVRRGLAADSLLGVHRAENRLPVPDESAFERRVQDDATTYLREMGVDPELYRLMTQVPPGAIRLLRPGEATQLALVNSPAAAPPAPAP